MLFFFHFDYLILVAGKILSTCKIYHWTGGCNYSSIGRTIIQLLFPRILIININEKLLKNVITTFKVGHWLLVVIISLLLEKYNRRRKKDGIFNFVSTRLFSTHVPLTCFGCFSFLPFLYTDVLVNAFSWWSYRICFIASH